jgi:hypothetical protein
MIWLSVRPWTGGVLMVGTYHIEAWVGWVFGFAAAAMVLRPLGQLVAARLRRVPLTAVPVSVWSQLLSGLMYLGTGLAVFGYAPGWLRSVWLPLDLAVFPLWVTSLVGPGIVSRKKAGLAWWRFGTAAPRPPGK